MATAIVSLVLGCSSPDSGARSDDLPGGDAGNDGVQPAVVDKDFARASIDGARAAASALAAEDPDKLVEAISGLIANSSEVIRGRAVTRTSALSSASSGPTTSSPGSATCDAKGCVFAGFLHIFTGGYADIFDGTASLTADGALALDVTMVDTSSPVGPTRVVASWTIAANRLDGSFRWAFEHPSDQDVLNRYDGVTFAGDQITGGALFARWTSASFGVLEGTVSFP
jgi:hypothetical protein